VASENSAFATTTAETIGKSRRSVEIAASRGEALGDDRSAVAGTSRAERRLGEMLREQKETVGLHEGGRPSKTGSDEEPVSRPTLADAGIDKKLSSRAQKLAEAGVCLAIPLPEAANVAPFVIDWLLTLAPAVESVIIVVVGRAGDGAGIRQ